jgi:hypothetical protein
MSILIAIYPVTLHFYVKDPLFPAYSRVATMNVYSFWTVSHLLADPWVLK